ncbi:MAG TPA: hypothetical protein VKG86_02420 [Terracidiphilus sp.]|nr:hypothetical protein [Terracidiphilus sp.]
METNLRPLTLGEILDRTAQLYRDNFVLFAGIAAVYAGFVLVLNLAQIGLTALLRAQHMTQQLPWVTLGYLFLFFPLATIIGGVAMAANNRAVAWVHLGQPATIRGAYQSILPRLGRYLWLMIIATFIVYLPFALVFGSYFLFLILYVRPKGLLAHAAAGADPQATIVFGLATLALILLAIPAIIYAIVMALRYSLAVPALVVEDLKARKALRRSIELSKGALGRIFVLGLLIAVIQIGLALVTQVFFIVAAVKHHGQLPLWVQVAQQIVGFFTNSFIGPMYATGLTLFYYDQRVRKEGFDIEWMMQAAGLTVPAAEPPAAEPTQAAASEADSTLPVKAVPEVASTEPAPPQSGELV